MVVGVQAIENVGIGDRYVKEKPENILVHFSTFQADMIVTAKLVISIDSAHVSVVLCNGMWAWVGPACAIAVLPRNSRCGGWVRAC